MLINTNFNMLIFFIKKCHVKLQAINVTYVLTWSNLYRGHNSGKHCIFYTKSAEYRNHRYIFCQVPLPTVLSKYRMATSGYAVCRACKKCKTLQFCLKIAPEMMTSDQQTLYKVNKHWLALHPWNQALAWRIWQQHKILIINRC